MKKIIHLALFIFLSFTLSVQAEEYETNVLIPVDTVASVKTEKFNYNDFIFNSQVDSKGNGILTFNSIQNNMITKTAVSINLLMFGEDQTNIGFLTYCTDKDVSSNYAGFKLSGNQSAPFSISVTSKYFVEGKGAGDVRYVAVMDENKYCQIGGYDKYSGQTIDQIINGVSIQNSNGFQIDSLLSFFQNEFLQIILIYGLIVLAVFIINGLILNTLYKRMYAKTTALAYLPITNAYISVKMAFGHIVATVYIILYILSILLVTLNITFVLVIINVLYFLSFLVVIIKLITKKYDLFYFEPSIQNVNPNNIPSSNNDLNEGNYIPIENQPTLDLSYEDQYNSSISSVNTGFSSTSSYGVSSSGNSISSGGNMDNLLDNPINGGAVNLNSNDEESDLTKFFR